MRLVLRAPALTLTLVLVLVLGAHGGVHADEVQLDRVWIKGNPEPMEVTIVEEGRDFIRVRRPGSTSTVEFSKNDIERIERAERPEQVFDRRMASTSPTDARGYLDLAAFALRFELDHHAERAARAATKASPRDPEAYRLLSRIYRDRLKRVTPEFRPQVQDQELAAYESAEAAGVLAAAPDLGIAKARLLRALGEPEGAIRELERIRAALAGPGAGDDMAADLRRDVLLELAELYVAVARFAEAEAAFQEVAAGTSSGDVRALIGRGLASFARGDLAAAARSFDEGAAAAPGYPDPVLFRAIVAYHQGDVARAAEKLRQLIEEDQLRSPELFLYAGLVEARQGRRKAAGARLRRALEIDPAATEATLGLAFVAECAGDHAAALALFDEAVMKAEDPALAAFARFLKAQSLAARGALPTAEVELRQAARMGFDFGAVAAELGRVRRLSRDYRQAVRFARYAADRRAKDPVALYELGLSYLGAGAPGEAEAAFDAALAVAADHAPSLCGKAAVLYGRGDYDAAEALFIRALAADGANAYAKAGLRRLEEARSRRLWRDDFDRPESKDVRNRWREDERFGVEAKIAEKRLVLKGTQAHEGMEQGGRTAVLREIKGARLAEWSVRFDPTGALEARVGIRLTAREGEIVLFRAPGGAIYAAHRPGGKDQWAEAVELATPWPAGAGAHALAIAVDDLAKGDQGPIVYKLDGKEIGREKLSSLAKTSSYSLAIYVQAPIGTEVDLTVEEARIYVQREAKEKKGGGF